MPSIAEKLSEVEEVLRDSAVADPRGEASLLLTLAINKSRTFLIAHPEYELDAAETDRVDAMTRRRASREPYQYIAGIQEFYGLEFVVTSDVLIPRPETEMVVERAIEILSGSSSPSLSEIGVGSGCISISILHNVPNATALGVDVSTNALQVARINSERNGVSERLALRQSDVFSTFNAEKFDLIVSNPPYVPSRDLDGLQPEVRDYEPHLALFGGDDGLAIIRRIVHESPRFLTPEGYLLMEIGFDQSAKVAELFGPDLWHEPNLLPDLQGIPRLVSVQRKGTNKGAEA